MDDKIKRAERISLASMLIGVCTAPVWILLVVLNGVLEIPYILTIQKLLPLAASLAGIVLGIVGLIQSIRKRSRSKKGIVFSVIGIILNLLTLCATVLFRLLISAVSVFA
jgi:hypothetical protein